VIQIEVVGHPTPQGSKKAFVMHGKARMTESSGDRLRTWRQDVKAAAIEVRPQLAINGPVGVALEFRFPRPKGHYGSGRNAANLKPSAPAFPTSRATGDIEKLIRSTHDALTAAGIWIDDSVVASVNATKTYADDPAGVGATIWIQEMSQ
jgi:Holliday junction resolvase RusA-like endonuclease